MVNPSEDGGIVALSSVILMLTFGFISGTLYGGEGESASFGQSDHATPSDQYSAPPDDGMRQVVVEVGALVPIAARVAEGDTMHIYGETTLVNGNETFTFNISKDSCIGILATSAGYNGDAGITVSVREDGDIVSQGSDPYGVKDVYYPRGGDGTDCGAG